MGISIGIDTGGTFVDIAAMDEQCNVSIAKTPTTPWNYIEGIIKGLEIAAQNLHISLQELLRNTTKFIYGTTVATNDVLEGKGRERAGLIVTKGFRDTLYIRRGMRRSAFDTQDPFPEPIIRRFNTREINERMDSSGNVLVQLDEDEVRLVVRELVKGKGQWTKKIEAIAICLLHSYVNPIHERRVEEIIREEFPHLFITPSIDVAPEIREYERMSTISYNASVGKIFTNHLVELEKVLRGKGLNMEPQIILSSGGTSGIAEASLKPVYCLFSGPAGGVIAAQHLSVLTGFPNIISVDMGGTSFDVGLIVNGEIITTMLSEIASYPVLGERIDIHSIGAGGGSIAWVDEGGILKVGPNSAGANPGPACYDKGGTEPTVTDANIVLGYIDPDYFLGGAIKLNSQRAVQTIKERIADKAGLSLVKAASGINKIVNNNMVNAMRVLSVERGYDPRDFIIMAFGGAGALHASAVSKELGAKGVMVPFLASVFSAFGMLVTDLRHSYSRTYRSLFSNLNLHKANELMLEMKQKAESVLEKEGVTGGRMRFEASMDLSYEGQIHELNVPISDFTITKVVLEEATASLAKKYEALYGFREKLPVQLVTLRLNGIGETSKPSLKKYTQVKKDASPALKRYRKAYFEEKGDFVNTPIYDFSLLKPGNEIEGPAIIEYPTTTLLVPPEQRAYLDEWLNVIIT